jgi:hypothetical protein
MSPLLNNVAPGLGTGVGIATQRLDKVADMLIKYTLIIQLQKKEQQKMHILK